MVSIKCALLIDISCWTEKDGATFANADNSSWYFECRNGSLLLQICPTQRVFHNESKQCVLATSADNSESIQMTLDIRPDEIPNDLDAPLPPSADLLHDENPCPRYDTQAPTYFASRFNCDKYFMCYRSRPLELSCCRGHHWSQPLQKCIQQSVSSCGIRHEPAASGTATVAGCPARGCATYPHPTVCEYFYYCEEGVQSVQQCDAFYQWDLYAQRCVLRSEAKCITSLPAHLRGRFYLDNP